MPLRLRLTALFTLALGLVVVVGGAIYLHQLSVGLLDATDASLRSRIVPLRADVTDLPPQASVATASPSSEDPVLLTVVTRPDGAVAQESPALQHIGLLDAGQLTSVRNGHAVLVTRAAGGVHYRVLAEPVARPDGTWTVLVAAPLGEMRETQHSLRYGLLVTGSLVVLFGAAGAWALGSAAFRAVDRMRRSVEEMTAADLAAGVRVPAGHDELADLGVTFNALLDRLAHALSRQRRFVADASHELRGPLAVLRMELELADRPHRDRDQLAASVRAAAEEVERLARLADDLLFLARTDDGALQVSKIMMPVEPLLRQAVDARSLAAAQAGVTLEIGPWTSIQAPLDGDRVRHALDNLLANAVRAAGPAGQVVVVAGHDAGVVTISVRDSGPGFPAEFLPRAFERFTRPDDSRTDSSGGAGLGLAIVHAVAEAHGGAASARNLAGGGAEVTMSFPA